MDEMKIESKFMTAIASRLVKKIVREKLGYEIEVRLNNLRTTVLENNKTHLHLDIDLEMTNEELNKLLKNIGL